MADGISAEIPVAQIPSEDEERERELYEEELEFSKDENVTKVLDGIEKELDGFLGYKSGIQRKQIARRYLRQRSGDIDKAITAFRRHLEWRLDACVSWFPSIPSPSKFTRSINQGKAILQGRDSDGRSLMWIDTGKHVMSEVDWEETREFILFMLEHALAYSEGGEDAIGKQFVIVMDFDSFSLESLDTNVPGFLVQMLLHNYPGLMYKLMVVSDSYLAWGLWSIVMPFLDERSRRKIVWGLTPEDVLSKFGPGNTPEVYGGTMKLEPPPEQTKLFQDLYQKSEQSLTEEQKRIRAELLSKPKPKEPVSTGWLW